MGAKHRLTQQPAGSRSSGACRARRGVSRLATACNVASASLLCTGSLALVMTALEAQHPAAGASRTTPAPAPIAQPVSQEGTVIAVSPDSVTARSANGYTQTYLVGPNTTVVTDGATQPATTASRFRVNEQVDIVGTVQGGKALATTVADRDSGREDGAPMDYGDGQPAGFPPSKI